MLWCPKRRRALGDAALREYGKAPFRPIAEEFGFWIAERAVEDGPVHVFLAVLPQYASARVVGSLKCRSARRPFPQCPRLRRKHGSGERGEAGDAVCALRERVTAALIRRSVGPPDAEQATNQPELF